MDTQFPSSSSFLHTEHIARTTEGVEYHPLHPFLPEGCRVLFLGSFPPQRKRWCMDFFYPNKINDMWRIMGVIFFDNKDQFWNKTENKFILTDIKLFLDEIGLALYDTGYKIRRLKDNASDKFLEIIEQADIKQILIHNPSITAIITAHRINRSAFLV